jgi:DNA-directed RNA polymerase specialized sigma24 family protein
LAERLSLWDIDDCVAFVATIVNRSGLELSWSDREDLEQTLQIVAWELSLKFEPGQSSVGFSTYCGTILRRRTNDWVRKRNGRTIWKFKDRIHIRERPVLLSIDNEFTADSLGNALAASRGDAEADRDENGGGLFGDRDQRRARDLEALGHSEA